MGARISVKDIVKTDLLKAQNETYVKILPLRFSVEFGERNALIYYLKKVNLSRILLLFAKKSKASYEFGDC